MRPRTVLNPRLPVLLLGLRRWPTVAQAEVISHFRRELLHAEIISHFRWKVLRRACVRTVTSVMTVRATLGAKLDAAFWHRVAEVLAAREPVADRRAPHAARAVDKQASLPPSQTCPDPTSHALGRVVAFPAAFRAEHRTWQDSIQSGL